MSEFNGGEPSSEHQPHARKIETHVQFDQSNKTSQLIASAIQEKGGKIPYSEFMGLSLYGPEGYYSAGKAKIGGSEHRFDFTTAATTSEFFGGTIGMTAKSVWEAMGKPQEFTFVEMGAGSGIMAKDLLMWAQEKEPEFFDALRYVIVEYGDLIEKQKLTLNDAFAGHRSYEYKLRRDPSIQEKITQKVEWVRGSAIDLPLGGVEGVIFSNELPDAFPAEVVKRINGQVVQKYVSLEDDQWVERWDEPTAEVKSHIEQYGIGIEADKEQAINLRAVDWQKQTDRALKKGAIITVDYGETGRRPQNGRATRTYPHDKELFAEYRHIGDEDITTDANFSVLEQVASQDGMHIQFNGFQNDFLKQQGVDTFIESQLNAFLGTRSLQERLDINLEPDVVSYRNLFEPKLAPLFHGQMLTKDVDVPTQHQELPVDFGIRLLLGRPKKNLLVKEAVGGSVHMLKTDDQGNLDVSQSGWLFDPRRRYEIYEGPDLVLDTHDHATLQALFEQAGLEYDVVV